MIILSITDIHNKTAMIDKFADIAQNADLILITGDITNFGKSDDIEKIINVFRQYNPSVLAIGGNCDSPEAKHWLKSQDISLDNTLKNFQGLLLSGIDSLIEETPDKTPLLDINTDKLDIFISHQPPYNTKIDVPIPSYHTGSKTIRKIIETYKPSLAFAGHIHEAAATDHISDTVIANPGPFANGGYVYTEVEKAGDKVTVKTCQIKNFLTS